MLDAGCTFNIYSYVQWDWFLGGVHTAKKSKPRKELEASILSCSYGKYTE
jgi:hypothetical protein